MATMTFKKASKLEAKARVAVAGPAGSGKSYTALKLATIMCKRVAVIDTEHGSASKYADEFNFDVLELDDFHPDNYVAAIQAAEAAGYDGLVIDSASHEWNGKNGCLELVDYFTRKSKSGNSYVAWGEVTPMHTAFIEAIHAANMHIFATFRSKMDYLQTEGANGKKIIQKVGMAPITRDGAEYEFDIVGDIDLEHNMVITKSRCKAIADKAFRMPGEDLAKRIQAWLSDGGPAAEKRPAPAVTQPATPPPATAQAPPPAQASEQAPGSEPGSEQAGSEGPFPVDDAHLPVAPTAAQVGALNKAWDALGVAKQRREEFLGVNRPWSAWEKAIHTLEQKAAEKSTERQRGEMMANILTVSQQKRIASLGIARVLFGNGITDLRDLNDKQLAEIWQKVQDA